MASKAEENAMSDPLKEAWRLIDGCELRHQADTAEVATLKMKLKQAEEDIDMLLEIIGERVKVLDD